MLNILNKPDIFVMTLVLAASLPCFGKGGITSSGTNEYLEDHNPYFLEEVGFSQAIQYCVQFKQDEFSIDEERAKQIVRDAIAVWKNVMPLFYQRPIILEEKSYVISYLFEEQENCDEDTEFKFKFGVEDEDVRRQRDLLGFVNVAFARPQFDQVPDYHLHGRGKGYLYIPGDKTEDVERKISVNQWKPWKLGGTIIHELGHVLGFPHIPGSIMGEEWTSTVLEEREDHDEARDEYDLNTPPFVLSSLSTLALNSAAKGIELARTSRHEAVLSPYHSGPFEQLVTVDGHPSLQTYTSNEISEGSFVDFITSKKFSASSIQFNEYGISEGFRMKFFDDEKKIEEIEFTSVSMVASNHGGVDPSRGGGIIKTVYKLTNESYEKLMSLPPEKRDFYIVRRKGINYIVQQVFSVGVNDSAEWKGKIKFRNKLLPAVVRIDAQFNFKIDVAENNDVYPVTISVYSVDNKQTRKFMHESNDRDQKALRNSRKK